jgi:S1-C subfamily serine protease
VQLTWESEAGKQELIGTGVVIRSDGLVLCSIGLVDPRIPDEQLTDFKIIVPRDNEDDEELDATFLGRDERTNLAYVQTTRPQNWPAVQFSPHPIHVGDRLFSIGMLPKAEGYRTYLMQTIAAAELRGEIPHIMTTSGLGDIGSPVFDSDGHAVGIVNIQANQSAFLNAQSIFERIQSPPMFFVPANDFTWSFDDLPVAGIPMKLPWIGVVQMAGINKDVAEALGLKNRPAVEIGDVIPGAPADHAGLKPGDKIVQINGQPLRRGDRPEELPSIIRRQVIRMKVGQSITLGLYQGVDQPLRQVTVTLDEQPRRSTLAKRFYADDLGFTAREMVFYDTYLRRLPSDAKGVVVAFVKPSSTAATVKLQVNDIIVAMNRQPVDNLEQFERDYKLFRKTNPHDPLVLVVLHEGQTQTLRLEPPQ